MHLLNSFRMFRDEKGGITVLWVLLLTLIIGALGLGTAVNSWYLTRTDLQKATDAAAIGASYSIPTSPFAPENTPLTSCTAMPPSANLATIACTDLAANGFSIAGSKVEAHNPPLSGIHNCANDPSNCNGYVEVLASVPVNKLFAGLAFGGTVNVSVRAVSGGGSSSYPLNVFTTSPVGSGLGLGITLGDCYGDAPGLTVNGGSAIVDSGNSSTNSLTIATSPWCGAVSGAVSAAAIFAAGGTTCTGCVTGTTHYNFLIPAITNIDYFLDPHITPPNTDDPYGTPAVDNFAAPPFPTISLCDDGGSPHVINTLADMTFVAGGTYCGTIDVKTATPVTFPAATYIGQLTLYNGANVRLNGGTYTANIEFPGNIYRLDNLTGSATLKVLPTNPGIVMMGMIHSVSQATVGNSITLSPGTYNAISIFGNESTFVMNPPASNFPGYAGPRYTVYSSLSVGNGFYDNSNGCTESPIPPNLFQISPGSYRDVSTTKSLNLYPGVYIIGAGGFKNGNPVWAQVGPCYPTTLPGGQHPTTGGDIKQILPSGGDIEGVTFFFNPNPAGSFGFGAAVPAKVILSATKTGPYAGLLFYGETGASSPSGHISLNGNTDGDTPYLSTNPVYPSLGTPQSWNLQGTIYAPDFVFDTSYPSGVASDPNLCLQIITKAINIPSGTISLINLTDPSCPPEWAPSQLKITTPGGSAGIAG